MFDVDKILTALQTDETVRSKAMIGGGGAAAGLAAGMLMGRSGRKMLGGAAKYGAVAALGGLAYHAWQKSRQDQPGAAQGQAQAAPADTLAPPPADGRFLPPPADEAAADALGQALVRAMIAAAKSDGKIDGDEKERIFARLNTMELDAASKAFVFDELGAPLDVNAVVAGADTPEHAAEIYAASLVAIEADTAAEKAYLQMLAARLELQPELVAAIHQQAGASAPA